MASGSSQDTKNQSCSETEPESQILCKQSTVRPPTPPLFPLARNCQRSQIEAALGGAALRAALASLSSLSGIFAVSDLRRTD